jgi:glycosyltransferase involved in cell wall biosynthesis
MKILFVSPDPLRISVPVKGVPTLFLLWEALERRGHQVLYYGPVLGDHPNNKVYSKVSLLRLKIPNDLLISTFAHGRQVDTFFKKYKNRILANFSWALYLLCGLSKARRIINVVQKVDLVYGVHLPSAPVAKYLAARFGSPCVQRLFGVQHLYRDIQTLKGKFRRVRELLAFRFRSDCYIITNDGTNGDKVARWMGISSKHISYLTNGVRKDWYWPDKRQDLRQKLSIEKDRTVILTVGRLSLEKRTDRALTALQRVSEVGLQYLFLIIGDGPERDKLQLLAQQLGLKDRVKFVGAVGWEQIPHYLNVADIFVSTQDLANLSNTLLEAMACGKCVVTIDIGNYEGILKDGDNCRIAPLPYESSLAKIFIELIPNRGLQKELGSRAREFSVKHLFSWEERIQKEIELLEGIVGRY